MGSKVRHSYHLVDESPWPFLVSTASLFLTLGAVLFFHFFVQGLDLLYLGLFSITLLASFWWRDIIREGTFLKKHSEIVMKSIRFAFILFIVSEAMLFFSFFWAFFHSSLAPSIAIGSVWPPFGMEVFNPWEIPLLNTIILLSSGATITLAHLAIIKKDRQVVIDSLFATLFFAVLFTLIQGYEYLNAPFSMSDGIYGSVFFMLTGFHGMHVIIGTIFIVVQFFRFVNHHFNPLNHFGFEAAAWYWHFVDVVWLFLFLCLYLWGNWA